MRFNAAVHVTCCHCGKTVDSEMEMTLEKDLGAYVDFGFDAAVRRVGFVLYDGGREGHGDWHVLCGDCFKGYCDLTERNWQVEDDFLHAMVLEG